MIKKYASLSGLVLLIGLISVLSCTNKEINLITNIDFDAFVEGPEEGFVKDSLAVTVSVIPQRPYPDFYYYAKYKITQGEGYFVDNAGELIPEDENRLLLEEENYTANWIYIGTSAEEHLVTFYYEDNYERRKEAVQGFTIKNVAILWEATSEITTATVKDSVPVQLQLANQTEGREVDFSYSITLSEGAGELLDADKEPIEKGKPFVIVPGTTALTFIPLQGGPNTLVFDLTDSNGQELQDTLSFEIAGEVINLPPTAIDDEVEVIVGMEKVIEVLANDTDPETDMLKVEAIVRTPNNGAVVINEDGTITYTPKTGLPPGVSDSFTYIIKDDPKGNLSENEATVNITFIDRPTIPIADEVFEQKLIDEGHDTDGVVNGVMYKDDAEAIVTLEVTSNSSLNISSFTGIEYFVNLEDLSVNSISGMIENFDLSGNPKLTKLSFGYASVNNFVQPPFSNLREIAIGFGGLIGIDFTAINSLEVVTLTNASYKDVDFSNLKNLKTIKIPAYGNLESLNLEGVSNLESLEITTSAITSLELSDIMDLTTLKISQSSSLECVQVKDISEALTNTDWIIQQSPLAYYSIDCSQPRETIAIPDAVFEQVLIDEGYDSDGVVNQTMYKTDALSIIELDVSKNRERGDPTISIFDGIEFFENMTTFKCTYEFGTSNIVTKLDLSKNIKLKTLNLSWLVLPSDFSMNSLVEIEEIWFSGLGSFFLDGTEFSGLSNLKRFVGGYMNLGDLDLRANTLLEELGIGAGISSINIRGLSQITSVSMSSGATIPELNLNDAVNLRSLTLSQVNGLSQLDISNNINLEEFTINQSSGIECIQVNNLEDANNNPNWNIYNNDVSYYSLDCSQPRATVAFNNPALEQALFELGHDSAVDNMVYRDKVENLTTLDVSEKGLTSLDGIELFTDLESLSANKNSLTSVDLSENTALTEVYLDENQLTTINVSANKSLKILKVWKNNISNIDLSKNIALVNLDVDNNSITSINVSANINLEKLDVKNNRLTSLDLINNTKLKSLAAGNRTDITNQNAIASVNVSNLSDLESLSLTAMRVLTELDVSNNKKLRILGLSRSGLTNLNVSQNVLLEDLNFHFNYLTNIDISANIKLRRLNVGSNQLFAINLTALVNLERFAAFNARLSNLDVSANTKLKELLIPRNPITTIDIINNTLLEKLDISENNIDKIDLTNLNQSSLSVFEADTNPNLTCIAVNDIAAANANTDWKKDATASYKANCP